MKTELDTTMGEQLHYISITLRETVSIIFHRLFHRDCVNCGKHGK
jgi:hypothetical protein